MLSESFENKPSVTFFYSFWHLSNINYESQSGLGYIPSVIGPKTENKGTYRNKI